MSGRKSAHMRARQTGAEAKVKPLKGSLPVSTCFFFCVVHRFEQVFADFHRFLFLCIGSSRFSQLLFIKVSFRPRMLELLKGGGLKSQRNRSP